MAQDRTSKREGPLETLEGSVERVTYHNDETGFCVLRVQARGRRELETVVGQIPSVTAGEWVKAGGRWVVDREHGRQFRAETLGAMPPDSIEGIEKFLGSGLIRGIGPIYAKKLVGHFGKGIFDIIETQSALLEQVEGIGKIRRQRIKESWNEAREVRAIMTFLLGHGVSAARAFRIYKQYGADAIRLVREDPYCLLRDVRGIGFKSADQIAERLGIAKDSDLRARAGVEHVLLELTDNGHCAFPRRGLVEQAQEILQISEDIVERAVDHGLAQERLVLESGFGDEPLIYLAALYQAETELARRLRRLADGPHPCPPVDTDKAIAWVEQKTGLTLAPAQRDALCTATHSKVMVITGGPGVGKTTLVNAILRVFAVKKLAVVLCAPTGRAAKRMNETTGREAKTIHRLLAFDPGKGAFRHNDRHPLTGDVFIVDEASMIDLPLANQLVRAIPSHAALLLVGDIDQLPSVGPGLFLRDVIESEAVPVCRLLHVFRQAAQSAIISNAHAVNEGGMPSWKPPGERSDFYFAEEEDPNKAAALIVKMVRTFIPEKFGLDPVRDIQVLAPMRRGELGSVNLNRLLQDAINPSEEGIERFGYVFRLNDKVMQMENDYDKDVFNGDLGRVVRLNTEDREMTVRFEGRNVTYDLQELDELVPAYAITIHKSQGSEYPCVVIPVHTQHYILLQRNLLYTAITRGKKLVVLVGTKKALAIAVKRIDTQRRITRLRERLRRKDAGGENGMA